MCFSGTCPVEDENGECIRTIGPWPCEVEEIFAGDGGDEEIEALPVWAGEGEVQMNDHYLGYDAMRMIETKAKLPATDADVRELQEGIRKLVAHINGYLNPQLSDLEVKARAYLSRIRELESKAI